MEITVAKSAGFCFGVKRAVEETIKTLEKSDKTIYSIGSLIHNEKVISTLKEKGLVELNDKDAISSIQSSTVIIRTHGIDKKTYEILKKNGNIIVDLTCPFVEKIHKIVNKYSDDGYHIIVIGDKSHPEVKGIVSYGENIDVILSEEDIKNLKIAENKKILVVFQTTTNATNAEKLVDILRKFYYNINIINTICNTTIDRQEEVKLLAIVSDVMIIIGSEKSSNTMKLYDIAKENCASTYIVNDSNKLENISIKENAKVGVSAGASTPQYLIEEILTNVRAKF